MAQQRETSAPRVYALLGDEPNLAVEDALLEALPDLEPELWPVALDTLIGRGRDRGLVGLVAGFDSYDPALQEQVLSRVEHLYAGARLGIADERLEVRLSAVALLARSGDTRLAYLLAEALGQPCHKTRAAAGAALSELTAGYLERRATAWGDGLDLRRLEQEGDYLSRALRRAVEGWNLHFRVEVLTAAMWMAGWLEDVLMARAASPRSSFARALLERLVAADDGRLAGFALRALRCPQLRSEVAKRIGANTNTEFIRGLVAESWLLKDPGIARECARIRHWAWLEADPDAPLALSPLEALGVLRLIGASNLSSETKVVLYGRLISAGTDQVRWAAFGRLTSVRTDGADALLRGLAQRTHSPLSAAAKRELRRRGYGGDQLPGCTDGAEAASGVSSQHPFDAFWRVFENLDRTARQAGAELVRTCPDLPVRLRAKLTSGEPADRIRGLKIARALKLFKPLEEQVYRLTSDGDPVTRSLAVAMLSELDGPVTRRIVRRALNDPDARVQSNAIEVLDRLPVSSKYEQLAEKLESPHHRVRATAAATLLKVQVQDAAGALLDMLSDPSSVQRISALWVVGRLRLSSLVQQLEEMAATDPDGRVRRRAQRVLRDLLVRSAPIGVGAAEEDGQ